MGTPSAHAITFGGTILPQNPSRLVLPLMAESRTIEPLDGPEIVHTLYNEYVEGQLIFESVLADRTDVIETLIGLVGSTAGLVVPEIDNSPIFLATNVTITDYELTLSNKTGQVRYDLVLNFNVLPSNIVLDV